MDRFRLPIIALVLSLAAITLVILDNLVMCRRILFCASPVVRFPDGVNVVQNGGFEDGNLQPNGQGFMPLPPGSTALPNWEIGGTKAGQDVAWLLDTNAFGITTPEGHRFLDLTGGHDVSNKGFFAGVQQTFSTVPRETYQVSLLIGWMNPGFPGPVEAIANLIDATSGQLLTSRTCGPFSSATPGPQWAVCRTGFVAKGTTTTIAIGGQDVKTPPATQYIGLDAVDVECVAPLGNHSSCT